MHKTAKMELKKRWKDKGKLVGNSGLEKWYSSRALYVVPPNRKKRPKSQNLNLATEGSPGVPSFHRIEQESCEQCQANPVPLAKVINSHSRQCSPSLSSTRPETPFPCQETQGSQGHQQREFSNDKSMPGKFTLYSTGRRVLLVKKHLYWETWFFPVSQRLLSPT